jgi:hypothetical protein
MAKTAMSFRLSDPAREKLTALGDIYGNMTTALELAIDRMHREEIAMLGTTLETAARSLLENLEQWRKAALVVYDDGTYDAVPAALLTDISWVGRGHVEDRVIIRELSAITGDDRAWDDLDTEEQNWAVQQMAESYAR